MQVKAISAPIEARVSPFGSAGFFVADSAEVASGTLAEDFVEDPRRAVPASVWVAVPFGRDVLLAAAMLSASEVSDLALMDDDAVREWVLGALLNVGTSAAAGERESRDFQNGYRGDADWDGSAEYFDQVGARIDRAFGFLPAPGPTPAESTRRPAGRTRRVLAGV